MHRQAERLNRRVHVIAESTLNDARLIQPGELGGYGLDAQQTFLRCKLDHSLRHERNPKVLFAFYNELIRLRGELLALAQLSKEHMEVFGYGKTEGAVRSPLERW